MKILEEKTKWTVQVLKVFTLSWISKIMYGNKTQTQLTLVKYVEFHVQKQKRRKQE